MLAAAAGGLLVGAVLHSGGPSLAALPGLMLQAGATLQVCRLRGMAAGALPLLAGLLASQGLAAAWLWGASQPGAGSVDSPWVAAMPWLLPLLVCAVAAALAWRVLAALAGHPVSTEGRAVLHWWLALGLAESLRRLTPFGGDYGSLALLAPDLPGARAWLPVLGGQMLAWTWLGFAALATLWLWRLARRAPARRIGVGTLGLALAFVLGGGAVPSWTRVAAPPLPVVALAPDRPAQDWTPQTRDRRVEQLLHASAIVGRGAVLVTSEGFFAEPPPDPPHGLWLDLVDGLARNGTHALVGQQLLAREGDRLGVLNAIVQLSPGRQSVYGKGILAPGGETRPWSALLQPLYRRAFGAVAPPLFAAPDAMREPLFMAGLSVAVGLCHELAFDTDLALRARDAELILAQADDSWTASPAYLRQVRNMARLRAMENAKPLLRVSEGGPGWLVDPQGRTQALGPGAWRMTLQPRSGRTLFAQLAPWLPLLPGLAGLAVGVALLRGRMRTRSVAHTQQREGKR